MDGYYEKYLYHPIRKPGAEKATKIDLIRSKDNEMMSFFYESAFYLGDRVISEKEYALSCDELFCFMNASGKGDELGATVSITVNGQKFVSNKCFMIEIPSLVPHGPVEITGLKSPVFFSVTGAGREHVSLPEENWKREDIAPVEDMVTYAGDSGKGDIVFECLPNETLKGDVYSTVRTIERGGSLNVSNRHFHEFPEILCIYGSDPERPYDLDGEFLRYIGGEEYRITEPTALYIAPHVVHCPVKSVRIGKDCIWHSVGHSFGSYTSTDLDSGEEPGMFDLVKPW